MSGKAQTDTKPKSGWLNVLVDYGPLAIFLGTYKWFSPDDPQPLAEIAAVIKGTLAFMVAAVAALLFSKFRLGRVSPMLWFSTGLIVFFGALTIFFGDPTFVQVKPTIIYSGFGLALLIGYFWKRRALLKILLEAAFEGVSEEGWLKLSRNWGFFFLFLAGLNEALRLQLSFESWLWAKFWVFMPLTFLFTFSQIPMLIKHGLNLGEEEKAVTEQPPTGE